MSAVKTHTFKTGKRTIHECHLLGMTEMPDDDDPRLNMYIPADNSQQGLATVIHEALHAEGLPVKMLDGGHDPAENVGRFLWRLGWRRTDDDVPA